MQTIGEKYKPLMNITDQAEATAAFERLVNEQITEFGKTRKEAEDIERHNIGYYAGYYDNETRERMERLFNCAHPVFGKIAEKGSPTFTEANKPSEPKEFYIGDVLSITTGRLLSPAKYHLDDRDCRIEGIYKIIGHMMGCEVWTHQLPAYAGPCKEAIFNQYPIFNSAEMGEDFDKYQAGFNACPKEDQEKYLDGWVSTMAAKYGETWLIEPIEAAEAYQRDPVEHLIEMRGGSDKGIITVTPE